MIFAVLKDKKLRNFYLQSEPKFFLFSAISLNGRISYGFRVYVFKKSINFLRLGSRTRIKGRCVFTGRSASVSKKFRLSRMEFRKLADGGFLPGLVRSSW